MKTPIRFTAPYVLTGVFAGLLAGCANTTPRWDAQFGNATRANLAAQVLDPAAGNKPNPATGIDGRVAKGAHDRYQRSFAQPESAPAPLIIGTGAR